MVVRHAMTPILFARLVPMTSARFAVTVRSSKPRTRIESVTPAWVAVIRERLRSARTRSWLPSSSSSWLRPPSPLIRVPFPPRLFDS